MTELDGWENFYIIVGSSAGALIGLQFVVMTLLADAPIDRTDLQAGQAFGSPNVVHFQMVLLISALVAIPWHGIGVLAILWGLIGIGGVIYSMIVARRMRSQKAYHAVLEDWLCYLLLPLAAYAMLAGSACFAQSHVRPALFVLGAATLFLLFIGIHNAWDMVTFHVFVTKRKAREMDRDRAS